MGEAEFRSIFERVHPSLMRMLIQGWVGPNHQVLFLPSRAEAEEVAAECWRVFIEHLASGKFERDRPAEPYLLGIGKNLALSRLRRRYTQEKYRDDMSLIFEPGAVDQATLDLRLAEGIERLEEPERTILDLKRAGVTEREIGLRLSLSRDQVRRRYAGGLRQLRRYFVEQGLVSEEWDALQLAE